MGILPFAEYVNSNSAFRTRKITVGWIWVSTRPTMSWAKTRTALRLYSDWQTKVTCWVSRN